MTPLDPLQLWAAEAGDMHAQALWDVATGEVEVEVTQGGAHQMRERFRPVYEPIFGLDVGDLATARAIASS